MTGEDEAERHAQEEYQPDPPSSRGGVALALSGGGYRAALFHLGALRRLNELGALSRVTDVSSVSGGSIMSAFLASRIKRWPGPGERYADFEQDVAVPLKRLTGTNIRTWPVAKRLLPWNWFNSQAQIDALASRYRRAITRLKLSELPATPEFIFCATDLAFAVNWEFRRREMGDYQAGYLPTTDAWTVARAVAASSCFPPVFQPIKPGFDPALLKRGKARGEHRDDIIRGLSLSDGGVYDNMGLEPVWKNRAVLLVSNGGAPFNPSPDSGLFWQLPRYLTVTGNQAGAIRKRWIIASFMRKEMTGAYWGIDSAAESYGLAGGYSRDLVDEIVSEVRTDLDAFSEGEQAVLENHGYFLAEAAVRRHAGQLISPAATPFNVPYPEWMDESRVRDALRDSAKRSFWGRR